MLLLVSVQNLENLENLYAFVMADILGADLTAPQRKDRQP